MNYTKEEVEKIFSESLLDARIWMDASLVRRNQKRLEGLENEISSEEMRVALTMFKQRVMLK